MSVIDRMSEVVGRQRARLSVEGLERFSGPGLADHDRGPRQLREIEGVQRLAVLEHQIVGGIHDIADGPRSQRREALRQPRRGAADGHAPTWPAAKE